MQHINQCKKLKHEMFCKPSKSTFLLIHFAIFSIGLIKLCKFLAIFTCNQFDFAPYTMIVNDWIGGDNNPGKLPFLLQYTYTTVALLCEFFLFLIVFHKPFPTQLSSLLNKKTYVAFYWTVTLIINLLFLHVSGQ